MNPDSYTAHVTKIKKSSISLPLIPIEDFIKNFPLISQNNPALSHDLYINWPTNCQERKELIKSFSNSIIKNPPPPGTIFTFTHQENGKKMSDKEFKKMMKPIIEKHKKVPPELKIYLDNNAISDESIVFLVEYMIKQHKTPEAFFLGLSNNNITIKGGEQLYQALIHDHHLHCELPDLLVNSDKSSEEEHANKLAEKIIRLSQKNLNFYRLKKGIDEISKQLDNLYYKKGSELDYEEKCLQETRKLIELKMEDYIAIVTQQSEEQNNLLRSKKEKDKLPIEQQVAAIQKNCIEEIGSKIAQTEKKLHRNFSTLVIDSHHTGTLSRELLSIFNQNAKILQDELNRDDSIFTLNNPPIQLIESNKSKLGTLGREFIGKLDERLEEIKKDRLIKVNKKSNPINTYPHQASSNATTSPKDEARSVSLFQENYRTNPLNALAGIGSIFNNEARPLARDKETAADHNRSLFTQAQRVNPLGSFSIAAVIANTSTNNTVEKKENQSSDKSKLKINI